MADYTSNSFRPLLNKLLALDHLFTPDALLPAQIGAFLTALHIHRVERRPEERALKAAAQDTEHDFVVDIVGTGGDGYNLFNVSTTAAIVAAGAGARVIKHGSRASTSTSGSADLLQALDCLFTAPSPGTPMPIPRIPFTFILAPHYHPALAFISQYRKALPFRTMFNVLGPLINPVRPRGMVLGVAEREIGETFAKSLREGGVERALVVCGYEGLDEISCAGPTWGWELKDGKITTTTLHPEQFGLEVHPLSSVAGGESLTPVLHFVLMNASALLVIAGLAADYKEGTKMAMESVTSGSAWAALEQFRDAGKLAARNLDG
ncbi:glycosyl transferase [Infundibulicybe gibba]|nr:glycosyl transferase [Infundibulicybe gibba]